MFEFASFAAESPSLGELRAGIVTSMREIVPCEIVSYNELWLGSQDSLIVVDPPDSADAQASEVMVAFAHQHPLVIHHARDGRALRFSDVITRRQLCRLELYQLLYRPLGIDSQMAIAVPITRGGILGIALNRGHRDFGDDERDALDLLRPHIRAAYERISDRVLLAQALTALDAQGDHSDAAVLLVAENGTIAYATPYAMRLLGADVGAALTGPLARWWATVGAPDAQPGDSPLVFEHGDRRLTARLLASRPDEPAPVVLSAVPRPTRQRLRDAGLTAREAEVLELLSNGMSNLRIAMQLRISRRTVEKHLGSIYARLGASSRTEALVRARELAREP